MAEEKTFKHFALKIIEGLVAIGLGLLVVFLLKNYTAEMMAVLSLVFAVAGVGATILVLFKNLSGLQQESRTYAHNISRRDTASALRLKIGPFEFRSSSDPFSKADSSENKAPAAPPEVAEPELLDTSNPDALFKVSRQRLLDEAVRIDAISRRNLGIGILFSSIALAVLAWPMVAAAIFPLPDQPPSIDRTLRSYLPRFSVGLLLQFVGFFFLRLYVANELDLKHNKNEITNLEMKMMALQLAKEFNDSASKKEIMKSLAQTERNFVLRKNERSVTTDTLSEYNDLRGLIEKLVSKIPGTK
jgi:hypothetical protein